MKRTIKANQIVAGEHYWVNGQIVKVLSINKQAKNTHFMCKNIPTGEEFLLKQASLFTGRAIQYEVKTRKPLLVGELT